MPDPVVTLYFAYGANLDRAGMARRCPRSRVVARAALRDHSFFIMAEGYASVRPRAGAIIHGLLWALDAADIPALDDFEAVAEGLYEKALRPVLTTGVVRDAVLYIGRSLGDGRPHPAYLALIVAAARQCGFPDAYLAELQRWGDVGDSLG